MVNNGHVSCSKVEFMEVFTAFVTLGSSFAGKMTAILNKPLEFAINYSK